MTSSRPGGTIGLACRTGELLGEEHDERPCGVVGVERAEPREQVVEDGADRVDVSALVDHLGARLLGRHEARRAQDDSRLRQVDVVVLDPTHAEVDHLHPGHALLAGLLPEEEDVLGLHVAVHDALCVGGREPPTDLPSDPHGERDAEPAHLLDERPELFAVEKLRDEVGRALARAVHVDDLNDVRVGDAAGALGLALEARHDLGVLGELGQQHLHRETLLAEA
ncbi:MAG: hypothetical protein IPQ09_04710 [Myxococcales bacterium]|nr:hypothetical protein [Myxococcales bacterium]